MQEDLTALERNMNVLHAHSEYETVLYVSRMAELAEYIETFTKETWNEATDVFANDTEQDSKNKTNSMPLLPTKAEKYL